MKNNKRGRNENRDDDVVNKANYAAAQQETQGTKKLTPGGRLDTSYRNHTATRPKAPVYQKKQDKEKMEVSDLDDLLKNMSINNKDKGRP